VDLPDPCGRGGLGRVDLLDTQAGLVLIQVLPGQPGALVVGPDERLAAGHVIQGVRITDVIAEGQQIRANRELMKGELVTDAPVGHGEPVI
jgi:hypothetical protein